MEGDPRIHIYTVAFNEPWFVELQHQQLQKHLKDDFVYCVVDNSSNRIACFRIKKYCQKHAISYVRIAHNPYTGKDPSRSHAYALNHIFQRNQDDHTINRFGVLDHDIFPFRNSQPGQMLLQQKAFGLKQQRDQLVYLWPGYMFFDTSTFAGELINCMPSERGDTAAQLGRYLPQDMKFATQEHRKFFDHGSAQADSMELIDKNWIHLINGSDWAGVGMAEKKQKLIDILADPAQLSV